MKYLLFALLILAACAPIMDTRTEPERAATRTARPIQRLHEGRLRIVLDGPVPPIAPAVVPNEASLLPTVTPTLKASE
jgi:hypothetical protein